MKVSERFRRTGFDLLVAPLVVVTGWRVARLDRRIGFEALLASLRDSGQRPLPGWLARPEALAGAVERWLEVAPPRRYGRCLRRALLLLGLWSRCGLRPKLHIGFRADRPDRRGHAWVTAEGADGARFAASGPLDDAPVFEL